MSPHCADMQWPDDPSYFVGFFRRAYAARVPLSGSLELTRRCNLRCVHCYLGPQERVRRDSAGREMTTAQLLVLLDEVAAAGCLNLLMTGGEPLLRPDFCEVYRHAKMAGLAVTVFTNGTLLTGEHVALFQDLPPRLVEITLYGATEETYERITCVPGSYRNCLAGVRWLHEGGIRMGLKTMVMTVNSHELDAMEQVADGLGARFRSDAVLNARIDGGREPLALRLEAREAVRLEFAKRERCQGWFEVREKYPQIGASDWLYQCGAGQTQFHVDAHGNLQPCLMLPWLTYPLKDGSFAAGWAEMAQMRETRAAAGNRCVACPQRLYCGYCPGLLAMENGDAEEPSAFLCALGDERLRALARLTREERYESLGT